MGLKASVATPVLLLEFFDAVLLIPVDLTEKAASPVKGEMGNGNDERILGVRSVEVQAARYAAFFAHVEDLDHRALVWWEDPRRLSPHHYLEAW